jgi:transposase
MSAAITMRSDFNGDELRRLARTSRDSGQVRRLLSLAAIAEGKSRKEAAAVGLMDRQTLRDWVHRFNAEGPAGLIDRQSPGRTPKLNEARKEELDGLVAAGPAGQVAGLARWRCVDLVDVVRQRFGVEYHSTSISRILRALDFSHISPRPRHPKQDDEVIEAFKKRLPREADGGTTGSARGQSH